MALSEYITIKGTIELGDDTNRAIIWGTGAPDGDSDPQKTAVKGSLYIRTDATDDESPLYLKVDENNSDDDWVQVFVANESATAGHDWNSPLTFLTDTKLQFRDGNTYIYSNSGSILHLVAASSVRVGDGTNETIFAEDGHMTMAGTARVYKDLWIPANQFTMSGCDFANDPIFVAGSMQSASMLMDVTGSAFADITAGSVRYTTLQPSANVTGSMTHAHAPFPVPTDTDTTGSVAVRLVWTSHDTLATTGSVFVFKAGATYISSSAVERTAASVGASPAYNYTAAGTFYETNLGNLPSFGANDVIGVLTVGQDQSVADDTGGSGVAILGVKLRYVAKQIGSPT